MYGLHTTYRSEPRRSLFFRENKKMTIVKKLAVISVVSIEKIVNFEIHQICKYISIPCKAAGYPE